MAIKHIKIKSLDADGWMRFEPTFENKTFTNHPFFFTIPVGKSILETAKTMLEFALQIEAYSRCDDTGALDPPDMKRYSIDLDNKTEIDKLCTDESSTPQPSTDAGK